LMALCDRLEVQLATNRTQKLKLLDALLHRALNDGEVADL
jgi:hypothetical protein